MKKFLVVLVAAAASLVAAQKLRDNQENKKSWKESTDSV
ncbi:MAG: DLW-39 family protein [Rothia sp. (in: high G+C Gram-positive bacteria)]|nr:DLW-39 family protein [Rothia sp. (in: high G+C Gram-positive bacteria)]